MEHEIINSIISKYSFVKDDVYIDEQGNMYKIDGFQLGYHFDFMDFYDLGWKGVISSVSDIISRGGKPKYLLTSLGINDVRKIEEILEGIKDACDYYEMQYVGGDLNSSTNSGWIDTVVIGKSVCKNYANKIQIGDKVVVTNPIGYTSLVFISYLNNWKIPLQHVEKNKIKHPIVNIHLLDIFEEFCENITYSTDISDGLVISLYNIIERSGKGIKIEEFPIADYVKNKMKTYGISIFDLLKYSGEEFESILVVKKEAVEDVIQSMKYLGFSPVVIGEIIKPPRLEYSGIEIKKTGWDNFSGWF